MFLRLASYGPGLVGWDSVNYITAARNLLAGNGLVDLTRPMVSWPPLYSAMLAGGGLFGIDPQAFAGPLNAVVFGLTVLVAGWWLRRHLHSRFLWLGGCFSIALALPLAEVASHAWSESTFILFVTLALTQVAAHLDSGGRAALIRAAAFSALACLTRYMGAAVILAVVPLLLAAARVAPREKVKHVAIYTLIVAVPVGLWMLRNYLLVGLPVGSRGRIFYPFPFIVDEAVRIAVEDWWLVGLTAPVLLALVLAACRALRSLGPERAERAERDAAVVSDVAKGSLRVFGGFALAYLALLVAAMMAGTTWGGLQWRYLAPVYVPLLFAALLLIDGTLRYARKRTSRRTVPRRRRVPSMRGSLLAVLMLALSLQAVWLVGLHARAIPLWNAGVRQGYAAPQWRDSESVQYIREEALTGAIWSNSLLVTALYADSLQRHYGLPCEPDHLRFAWSKALGSEEGYVLHFSDWRGECSQWQDDALRSHLSREPLLEPVAELADGKLYRLRERESLESRPAMFLSSDAPVEGESFDAYINRSHGRRLFGEPWRWQKGSDADGWTSLRLQRPTHVYTPTVADVGHRLRATVYYADQFGNRVRATTKPSKPVQPGFPKVFLAPSGREGGRGAAGAIEAHRIFRSKYDLYVRGNRLIYENRSCRREDKYGTRFWLTVYSLDSESGTPERDALDFAWSESSWQDNGVCITEHRLPDKDIVGIQTGQVDRDGNFLWEAEYWFEEKRRWFDGRLSSATSGEPVARDVFDIYLGEGRLIFVKDPCARADTEATFFLHLVPANGADLPGQRKQYGFDNLDFDFEEHGLTIGGACLAEVALPEYAISEIRTGQYIAVDGGFVNIWKAEFRR